MKDNKQLREHLSRLLDWHEAHVGFEEAVRDLPETQRGTQPAGLPYSPWQLVEHIRLAQRDILEFCRDSAYRTPRWPDDYWPATPGPPDPDAWHASVAEVQRDRDALKALANDPSVDLLATVPRGSRPTYLRELLLVADHTAYHVGQLIVVRRLLGSWEGST